MGGGAVAVAVVGSGPWLLPLVVPLSGTLPAAVTTVGASAAGAAAGVPQPVQKRLELTAAP